MANTTVAAVQVQKANSEAVPFSMDKPSMVKMVMALLYLTGTEGRSWERDQQAWNELASEARKLEIWLKANPTP